MSYAAQILIINGGVYMLAGTPAEGDALLVGDGVVSPGKVTDANIDAAAGIVDTKLATITTSGKVANSATTATAANAADTIVARNSNGGFVAGAMDVGASNSSVLDFVHSGLPVIRLQSFMAGQGRVYMTGGVSLFWSGGGSAGGVEFGVGRGGVRTFQIGLHGYGSHILQQCGISGVNAFAGDFLIRSGASTGNATASKLVLQSSVPGSSGSTAQTYVTVMELDGSVVSVATGIPLTLGGPLQPAAYTVGTVPSASVHTGRMIRLTDSTPAQRLAYSDGTNWRYVSDDATI